MFNCTWLHAIRLQFVLSQTEQMQQCHEIVKVGMDDDSQVRHVCCLVVDDQEKKALQGFGSPRSSHLNLNFIGKDNYYSILYIGFGTLKLDAISSSLFLYVRWCQLPYEEQENTIINYQLIRNRASEKILKEKIYKFKLINQMQAIRVGWHSSPSDMIIDAGYLSLDLVIVRDGISLACPISLSRIMDNLKTWSCQSENNDIDRA